MTGWFKTQLDKINSPTLDWAQVEVTTYCNSACIYCPRTLMKEHWTNRHLPLELFRKLVPFLTNTNLVFLQGWGEPLLNKDIFEMIRICKDHGNRVGFTTNGMLLNEEIMRTLVDLEIDILGASFAGTTAATHNKIRKGNEFDVVVSRLELLHKIKNEEASQVPEVHLAYLMLKSNFHELEEIVPLAKRLGAQQIVASNLTLIVEPKLSAEAIFNDIEYTDYYRIMLERIKDNARRENIIFDYNDPGLNDTSPRCGENVYRSCCINVNGEVVPCVFANPILCERGEVVEGQSPTYIFKEQPFPLREISFGNIRSESLTRIWNKKEYSKFRGLFDPETTIRPNQIISRMPQSCLKCYKRLMS